MPTAREIGISRAGPGFGTRFENGPGPVVGPARPHPRELASTAKTLEYENITKLDVSAIFVRDTQCHESWYLVMLKMSRIVCVRVFFVSLGTAISRERDDEGFVSEGPDTMDPESRYFVGCVRREHPSIKHNTTQQHRSSSVQLHTTQHRAAVPWHRAATPHLPVGTLKDTRCRHPPRSVISYVTE